MLAYVTGGRPNSLVPNTLAHTKHFPVFIHAIIYLFSVCEEGLVLFAV